MSMAKRQKLKKAAHTLGYYPIVAKRHSKKRNAIGYAAVTGTSMFFSRDDKKLMAATPILTGIGSAIGYRMDKRRQAGKPKAVANKPRAHQRYEGMREADAHTSLYPCFWAIRDAWASASRIPSYL